MLAFMKDVSTPPSPEKRDLGPALRKGWRRRCPHCGGGALFDGYLKVADGCDICGLELHHHRADDAPAWLTMIVVGHLLAPVLLLANEAADLPLWAHLVLWPTLAMTAVIVLLPRIKGLVVAFQWANRMHGFDDRAPYEGWSEEPEPPAR
ncbi:MAG: DUF983 domain-containing protein [Pseudomonadota bacterium]